MAPKFNYEQIEGVSGNSFVTSSFVKEVEALCGRLKMKPEHLLASMSFETGGRFDPAIQNVIGATGLIQFLDTTAKGLGTTTTKLRSMSATDQLSFVEKYFRPFKGKLDSLEAVYTAILSGSPKTPGTVLFKAGTVAYKLNPLDWNQDGKITAQEAATPVWARLYGGVKRVQQKLLEAGVVPENVIHGFVDGRWGETTSKVLAEFQRKVGLTETGLLDDETGQALFGTGSAVGLPKALKAGDSGEEVKALQDAMVALGYMSMEKIGAGHGKDGPETASAGKVLQKHLGFSETGEFGASERSAVKGVIEGVRKGSLLVQIVRAIQSRIVSHNYITQIQADTV